MIVSLQDHFEKISAANIQKESTVLKGTDFDCSSIILNQNAFGDIPFSESYGSEKCQNSKKCQCLQF